MDLTSFAVIGHPIGHTMSPFIHRRLFALSGLSPAYTVLDVPSIEAQLPALRALSGFNVTIRTRARSCRSSTRSTKRRRCSAP